MNSLFTEIEEKNILDGDCVKINFQSQRKSQSKSTFGKLEWINVKIEHAYVKDGKFISVVNNEEIIIKVPNYRIKFFLHKYKFISLKKYWYIEGTECFPDGENYNDNEIFPNGDALFQGLTDIGWDGETCSFDEFEITERKNQTRHRKLNRLLKD